MSTDKTFALWREHARQPDFADSMPVIKKLSEYASQHAGLHEADLQQVEYWMTRALQAEKEVARLVEERSTLCAKITVDTQTILHLQAEIERVNREVGLKTPLPHIYGVRWKEDTHGG